MKPDQPVRNLVRDYIQAELALPCAACAATGREEFIVHHETTPLRIAGTPRAPRTAHRIECTGGPCQMAGSPEGDVELLCFSMSEFWAPTFEQAVELWNEINGAKRTGG